MLWKPDERETDEEIAARGARFFQWLMQARPLLSSWPSYAILLDQPLCINGWSSDFSLAETREEQYVPALPSSPYMCVMFELRVPARQMVTATMRLL